MGTRLASSAVAPLIKKLFTPENPGAGAGLLDKPRPSATGPGAPPARIDMAVYGPLAE